jgi:hypothetical protein
MFAQKKRKAYSIKKKLFCEKGFYETKKEQTHTRCYLWAKLTVA